MKKRIVSALLALALLVLLPCGALAAGTTELDGTAAYLTSTVTRPELGSVSGDWTVIGLARSACRVPDSYFSDYAKRVEQTVKDCAGVLSERKYTEYSRVILTLTAIGKNPANVGGYNLLRPLGDYEKTVYQGINGAIWALIALDSGNYEIPTNREAKTQATRQRYLDAILTSQLLDGGWSLSGSGDADPDVTAMALQALAGYRGQKKVQAAVDKGVSCLAALQDSRGGYASWGVRNAESTAQVILALCALGISAEDSRFVKGGNTLKDDLLRYRQADGSFVHTEDGKTGSSQTATEQGFLALTALARAERGETSIYRMQASDAAHGKPNPAVSVPAVSKAGTTFDDIQGHQNQSAIEALAARGILNGVGKTEFQPNRTMTRAEFAATVARALGLPQKNGQKFADVAAGKWYAAAVGTASAYGIVSGVGGGKFNPSGTITRQEAAAMVARAAKLCGFDTALAAADTAKTLSQFGDYRSVSDWAREPVAFCYASGICDAGSGRIEPGKAIARCEIAQMIYNLLRAADLI